MNRAETERCVLAIVTGVDNFEQMLSAPIKALSSKAEALGHRWHHRTRVSGKVRLSAYPSRAARDSSESQRLANASLPK
ncbi:MAG TPA: DUF1805 domain-containing protein [Candidatus Norongarragalinales archaeon]|nr:DUF1805 domain-containing protein [Candidatus Norongarragalinales archaeon]